MGVIRQTTFLGFCLQQHSKTIQNHLKVKLIMSFLKSLHVFVLFHNHVFHPSKSLPGPPAAQLSQQHRPPLQRPRLGAGAAPLGSVAWSVGWGGPSVRIHMGSLRSPEVNYASKKSFIFLMCMPPEVLSF